MRRGDGGEEGRVGRERLPKMGGGCYGNGAGTGKEKAKGQLGSVPKGAANSSECVSHPLGSPGALQLLPGSRGSMPACYFFGALVWALHCKGLLLVAPFRVGGAAMPEGSMRYSDGWGSEDTRLPPSHSWKGGEAGCGDTRAPKATWHQWGGLHPRFQDVPVIPMGGMFQCRAWTSSPSHPKAGFPRASECSTQS